MSAHTNDVSPHQLFLVLHNIRSAENVGSLFRTADGAGVKKLCLVGITPHPYDRFGRLNPKIAKTSLGATEAVPYEAFDSIDTCLRHLRQEGCTIVAVEQDPDALVYRDVVYPAKVAFILGNEVEGIPHHVVRTADMAVYIPQYGKKESLNVSVAGGIVLFDAAGRRP